MSQRPPSITSIVVDDHTLFRDGVRELLATEPDIRVVGEGRNGEDAVTLASRLQPDVVLLDVEMPGPSPRLVIPQVRAASPDSRIIILTMHSDLGLAYELMGLGARAYLVKDVSREQLFAAVRTVMHDDQRTILASGRDSFNDLFESSVADRPALTGREQAVLALAARAMTNSEIGAALFIAEGTVQRHLSNVYRKLGAAGRLDALNKAVALRLIPPERSSGDDG
jgi:DNA-binding NarL/FixJ family response regulator